MHSLGRAPAPASAGRGSLGGMQSGLQCLESALTTWGTVILPATSKQETEVLRCPACPTAAWGQEPAVSDTGLSVPASWLPGPTTGPGGMMFYQVIVGQVSTPHQASVACP